MTVQVFWSISLGLAKGSILVLYAKVFSVPSFVRASKITAMLVLLWLVMLLNEQFLGAEEY